MEMEIDGASDSKPLETGDDKPKLVVVILIGAPGSGKSTFCEQVMASSSRPWSRVCQDIINNGKAGTKQQCVKSVMGSLSEGKSVFVDRCNMDREQRAEFVKLGGPQVEVHGVVLDFPANVCISRSVKRTGHEGNLQGGKAAAVVNRMMQKKELPKLSEGFSRIVFCHDDSDVQAAIKAYSSLGPSDTLRMGCFGQKHADAKIQLGIMKFLKKVEPSSEILGSNMDTAQESVCLANDEYKETNLNKELPQCSVGEDVGFTLAFPSISTADFQFDNEKAADIIVEKVEEFMSKLGNNRLVLVDLSYRSKILSLVRTKVASRNIDSKKFFTFVGDITKLYSAGGLYCNVIANAANWRLKPGGGGVNSAIFSAAGPALEYATKERAKSLQPGRAVAVPLPSDSPLFKRERVSHVIHVLGPNMNPQRPNCLNNDYGKGSKILREAYTALFECFVSIARNQEQSPVKISEALIAGSSTGPRRILNTDQKTKTDGDCASETSKKSKGSEDEMKGKDNVSCSYGQKVKQEGSISKHWGAWAQALYNIAMNPQSQKDQLLEVSDDVVVVNDLYPKAQRHILVLARYRGLDSLANVNQEHLNLLKTMHDVGLKWVQKFLGDDRSMTFRLGYHSDPSMRQLHLHVISQDFNSSHLKNKKHWNTFTTAFFRDSIDVIEEVRTKGKATVNDDDSKLLSMELRCHRCRSAHPNMPRLKRHINDFQGESQPTKEKQRRLCDLPDVPRLKSIFDYNS
ncbi:hypothetical protein K2173_008440 [Erythroxylum novogranatense]|uniref:Transcription factor bHLH140 n=1 Tax=Erythroxylum novogranatense TaxID=1862640 RepID=A0AAV8UCG9_9ROSI|nr:hypothetical protein K2173_008440 [Erythroxylum novogranatense]